MRPKAGTVSAVRSAHAIAIAELKTQSDRDRIGRPRHRQRRQPPVPSATGVTVTINGDTYTVLTYTDPTCSSTTAAVGNVVGCVGNITP